MNFTRRDFIKVGFLSAASMAMSACGRPVEHGVVSQYQMPEYTLPGQPLYWATCCSEGRADCAVAVKTVENRAIQTIGIPGNPHSKGAVSTRVVAGLQRHYHPDRLLHSRDKENAVSRDEMLAKLAGDVGRAKKDGPVWVVDRLAGSTGHLMVEMAKAVGARIWVADSQNSLTERRIMKALNGEAKLPYYPIEEADFLVTFASDFLHNGYHTIRSNWAYGQFRQGHHRHRGEMVSVSSRMSATDANSDIWLPAAPGTEGWVALGVASLLASEGRGPWPAGVPTVSVQQAANASGVDEGVIKSLASRLSHAKSPMAVGGSDGSANGTFTLYASHILNKILRAGQPEMFEPDALVGTATDTAGLFLSAQEALAAIEKSKAVWVFDVDIAYRYPKVAKMLEESTRSVYFGLFKNSTSKACKAEVPLRSWMADWGDLLVQGPAQAHYFVQQPVVRERHDDTFGLGGLFIEIFRTIQGDEKLKERCAEVVAALPTLNAFEGTGFRHLLQGARDERAWESLLVRGGVWNEESDPIYPHRAAYPPKTLATSEAAPAGYSAYAGLEALPFTPASEAAGGAGLVLKPFYSNLGDGSLSNLPWLQELPDTMTTVVWDSWVEISEQKAHELHLQRHDQVDVTISGKTFRASVYPSPSLHPQAVGIGIGRGHKDYGDWAANGHNVFEYLGDDFDSVSGDQILAGAQVGIEKVGGRIKRLTTFDKRLYNLPRHIFPE